jgi:NADH-quinone oxidoreductase subunit K
MTIGLEHFLVLSALLFIIGLLGIFIKRQNLLGLLLSLEVLLLAVNINLVSLGVYTNSLANQIMSIFILTVAAAEAAIGLALLLLYFKQFNSLEIK